MQANATPLSELALRQARVVLAVMLREMRTSYGRSQLGYAWAIIRPILLVAGISIIFTMIERPAPFGNSMPLFFATGMMPFFIFSRTLANMARTLERNEALLEYPIVKPIDCLMARMGMDAVSFTVALIICLGGMMYFLDTPGPDRVHLCAIALIGLALLAFGFGTINAVIALMMPSWSLFLGLLRRPLIFFSAVLYPIEAMPTLVQEILAWNPLLHGVELFRSGYYMGYRCSVLDVGYLFTCGLVLSVLGLVSERVLRLQRG